MVTFQDLNLPASLQKAIDDLGFTNPTPIQAKAFPYVMSGRDVMGIAQTGTGKTFAYLLPILKQWRFQKNQHSSCPYFSSHSRISGTSQGRNRQIN